MRPEEFELAIGRIAVTALRPGSSEERLRRFGQQLLEFPTDDQVLLVQAIGTRAALDLAAAQLLLLLADVRALRASLGSDRFERLRRALGEQPRGAPAERYLRRLADLAPDRLPLLRAKAAALLQTISTLNDRLESKRLPPLKLDGYELADRVLDQSGLDDARVHVDLSALGREGLAAARDVLLDAEFEEVDDDQFETTVTDDQIKTLGHALALGRVGTQGSAARLPAALVQRQALLIIGRFCLLCRTATMYPPDHPSLPPAYEGFRSLLERAIEDREQITFTVLAEDVLLDDVKIRKEDRLKKTFVDLCDERQVSSVTFRPALTVDEVKALVACFIDNPKTVKDAGGMRAILGRKGVTNIVVDQFRYRVVADDGTIVEGPVTATADRLLESVVYAHVLDKLERGGGIETLSVEEVGGFFKDLLSRPDEDKRRALGRLLIALDPGLLETGLLANPEVRRSLSWSAARKILDVAFRDLAGSDQEAKEQAFTTITQLTDLAIGRHKDTTVALIARRLAEYVATQESDPDLLRRATEIPAGIAIAYIKRQKLDRAARFVSLLGQIAAGRQEVTLGPNEVVALPHEGRAEVLEAARDGLQVIGGDDDAVDRLIRGVTDADAMRSQLASSMLETLATDAVVTRLFRLFLDSDRGVRSRGYRLLKKIGERSLPRLRGEIEERRLPTHPGRDPSSGVFREDSDWYILRNAMDLLAEIDPNGAAPLLAETASDPDPRVRRESLRLIARHAFPGAPETLGLALSDPVAEVREAAIAGVGLRRDRGAVKPLIDAFFRHPEHRRSVIEALGHIGSIHGADFLLLALDAVRAPGARRRRKKWKGMIQFPPDRDAVLQAITALGEVGGSEVELRLETFVDHWSNPLRRWSLRSRFAPEFLAAAANALALARRKGATGTGTEEPGVSSPALRRLFGGGSTARNA